MEHLELGEVLTSKELSIMINPESSGEHIEINVGEHRAALLAVWKMADEDRSPELESQVKEIVKRVNQYEELVEHLEYAVEYLKGIGHIRGGTPEALFKLFDKVNK